MGGAFGGYANDRIARLAQEAYPAQEPPPVIVEGPRPGKASEGRPQKVVIVVIVLIPVMFAS